MPDPIFDHPRLAAIYDALEPDRSDLVPYLELAQQIGARCVADLGCGTGVLALRLAGLGLQVYAVDPAGASLAVAQCKNGASRVQWIHGDAAALPSLTTDLVLMTGNAAQAVISDDDFSGMLHSVYRSLKPGGTFAFESRIPGRRAWLSWTGENTRRTTSLTDAGNVETWVQLRKVDGPLVSFRWTFIFDADGERLLSDSTLRFRERDEITGQLEAAGFEVTAIREAPDRPGHEYVFIARKPHEHSVHLGYRADT